MIEGGVSDVLLMGFKAWFLLENPATERITITVGFPFRNDWFDLSAGEPEPAAGKLSYKAYLDGVEIPVKLSQDSRPETAVYVSEITI